MTERGYASWVEPIAAALAEDRRRLLAFADTATAAFWEQPSRVGGWTNKDILAHLAGGNDMLAQTLLRSLTAGDELAPSVFALDTDAENARRVAERRGWPVAELIVELERDHAEVLGWLSQLSEDDRDVHPAGLGITVGQFFRIVQEEHHDLIHLDQLRGGRGSD